VRFDPKDGLYVALKPDGAARAKDLRISPGRFTVQVLADHPTRVEVREGGRTLALDDAGGFTLEADAPGERSVDLMVYATAATRVREIILLRQ
jgi:hypothetical protein